MRYRRIYKTIFISQCNLLFYSSAIILTGLLIFSQACHSSKPDTGQLGRGEERQANQPESADLPDEDYKIYSFLINTLLVKPDIKQIVIDRQTNNFAFGFDPLKNLVTYEIYDNYSIKNSKTYELKRRFLLPQNLIYKLVANSDLQIIDDIRKGEDGWENFYIQNPGAQGIVAFSRIGYDQNKDQALLFMSNVANLGDGWSKLLLLQKKDGYWNIKNQIVVSIP